MKKYDHIIRFALLLSIVIPVFLIARTYMIPESFGVHGSYTYAYYRADSTNDQASRPATYQGTGHCSTCHEPQNTALKDGAHDALDCESCHGGFKAHNNNTSQRMAISDPVAICMLCHAALNARPAEFPQIASFEKHIADQEETLLPDMKCATCHDPHAPM